MGVGPQAQAQAEAAKGDPSSTAFLRLDIDEYFFKGLAEFECEESARDALEALEANLRPEEGHGRRETFRSKIVAGENGPAQAVDLREAR